MIIDGHNRVLKIRTKIALRTEQSRAISNSTAKVKDPSFYHSPNSKIYQIPSPQDGKKLLTVKINIIKDLGAKTIDRYTFLSTVQY